jgi:predicted cytidylate kinase
MASNRTIVVSGDLGSGKSTMSRELAKRLGVRRVSVGDMYREMAQSRGMSALQLNLHAELDDEVDGYVDRLQSEIAKTDEQLVVDGRLAWFFFTRAFKVHLVVDPAVAAQRILGRPSDTTEAYSSLSEATERIRIRSESERTRFLTRYGVDKNRLRNYDMICDTTRAPADDVASQVIAAFTGSLGAEVLADAPPFMLLDPNRVYPSQQIQGLRGMWQRDTARAGSQRLADMPPITVGYAESCFYAVAGHRRLSAAITGGSKLIPATLLAERDEHVVGGLTAEQFFTSEVSMGMIYDWAAAHRIELPLPAHLARSAAGSPAQRS